MPGETSLPLRRQARRMTPRLHPGRRLWARPWGFYEEQTKPEGGLGRGQRAVLLTAFQLGSFLQQITSEG